MSLQSSQDSDCISLGRNWIFCTFNEIIFTTELIFRKNVNLQGSKENKTFNSLNNDYFLLLKMWCGQVWIFWNYWIQQNNWTYSNLIILVVKVVWVKKHIQLMRTKAYQCKTLLLEEHKNSVNMQLDPSPPHVWDMAWIPNCPLIFFLKTFLHLFSLFDIEAYEDWAW